MKPLLNVFAGLPFEDMVQLAVLDGDLPENDNRQDYMRATLSVAPDGRRIVRPFVLQDSSMQRTLQSSQALIVRAPLAPAAQSGDQVSVMVLDF